jgi:single-strand DNA-binding protein
MMNQVNLIGRLTRDPELRQTASGDPVANIRLAVDGRSDNDTVYVDVASFGKGAEAIAQYLEKGRLVAVSGRLVLNEWTDRHDQKRSDLSVIGNVQFLPDGSKSSNGSSPEEQPVGAGAASDDIPF